MLTVSHSTVRRNEYDSQAIARGQARADAHFGAQLLRELEAKWQVEGVQMFHAGVAITECWNDFQRAAWIEAHVDALIAERMTKPGLDLGNDLPNEFAMALCAHCVKAVVK